MFAVSARPFWGRIALVLLVLQALTGGIWAIEKFTIEHLLYRDAVNTGHGWASYLAQNVEDVAEIAQGQKPSQASMAFFERAQKVGNIFRYKIFDPEGYLRLVSDELTAIGTDAQNLSEHNTDAALMIAAGQPLVQVKEGKPPARPPFFAEAYVPVVVGGKIVAITEAYVDQTEKHEYFYSALRSATILLSLLMAFGFGIPAVAWYRRTREKQHADERIHFLAFHDALTGLPNRNRLVAKLEQSLAEAAATGGKIALHCVDFSGFKNINDTLGHDVGDRLIMAAAERLCATAGSNDFVARLGGNEFALVQFDVKEKITAERMALRIVEEFAKPFHLGGHELAVTVSAGIALAPDNGDDASRLLRAADLAMYKSKDEGQNCVCFFAPRMDTELQTRLTLEKLIREAALNERFELHYQPVVDMPDGRLAGFEALLRMRASDGSFISPVVFIPIAEQMGLIDKIGAWVIREACRTAATWPDHLTVAVNLSPAQFAKGSVHDVVASALVETSLDPHRLELEITESLLLLDSDMVLAELGKLKKLGVAIAMDDFGTGYSSLSYLWQFPFDKIKIDRSFILGFDAAKKNAKTIIETIAALGHSLRLRITVEGVETAAQLEFVRGVKCDQVQGFYFSRPVPVDEVAALILADFQNMQSVRQNPRQVSETKRRTN